MLHRSQDTESAEPSEDAQDVLLLYDILGQTNNFDAMPICQRVRPSGLPTHHNQLEPTKPPSKAYTRGTLGRRDACPTILPNIVQCRTQRIAQPTTCIVSNLALCERAGVPNGYLPTSCWRCSIDQYDTAPQIYPSAPTSQARHSIVDVASGPHAVSVASSLFCARDERYPWHYYDIG